jgi:hypothetical protein
MMATTYFKDWSKVLKADMTPTTIMKDIVDTLNDILKSQSLTPEDRNAIKIAHQKAQALSKTI